MNKKQSYDFYLILATVVVLAIISGICIYSMFYFKFAQINQMDVSVKIQYMEQMNRTVSPFIICLIILLGICVPKRLLPTRWLNYFAVGLIAMVVGVSLYWNVITALKVNLIVAMVLQLIVLGMALSGNEWLNFEKKGYWLRVGSSAMHLGIIMFILDLFFFQQQTLHLTLFWITTFSTVVGMIGCFYSQSMAEFMKRLRQ